MKDFAQLYAALDETTRTSEKVEALTHYFAQAAPADAAWLIADDTRHICTQSEGVTEYQLPGTDRCVSAVTFSRFLDHLSDIDLDHVDPSLLTTAFRTLG